MRPLTARESRLVAVLILLALVALVLAVIVGPIVGGFQQRAQERTLLAQRFQTNERRIAALDALQHEAERQQDALRGVFIAAPDADEAGETLREQVEATAQAAGVRVRATEAMQAGEDGWVRAALEAQMTHGQLADLLARLNRQAPPVVIAALTINAADAANNPKADVIDVRLEATAPFVRAR